MVTFPAIVSNDRMIINKRKKNMKKKLFLLLHRIRKNENNVRSFVLEISSMFLPIPYWNMFCVLFLKINLFFFSFQMEIVVLFERRMKISRDLFDVFIYQSSYPFFSIEYHSL